MRESVIIHSTHPEVTDKIGALIGERVRSGDVLRLWGELGAGKTAFVRGVARGMGLDQTLVNSPTYTLANEYQGDDRLLLHIDAYRIDDVEEALESIGLRDLRDADVVVCIEWPEMLGDAIDAATVDVEISHSGESEREIRLSGRLIARGGADLIRALETAGGTR